MARRLALFALCAMTLALVPATSQAACGYASTLNSATLAFGNVSIAMHENQPNAVCDDATVTPGDFDRRLTITIDGVVVCDVTEGVDPSFDPFFLGAGLHPDPGIPCGADFSVIGLANVATPDPSTVAVDPGAPSAQGGLTKQGITETPGRLWYGTTSIEIPQDTGGTITRGAGVSG